MTRQRSFLLLQGPQSRFFKRLGEALAAQGHGVAKVNFCGGDVLFWRGKNTRIFNGPRSRWPGRAGRLMDELSVTDLLLFGDRREIHRAAIDAARERNVRVWVFEEGYLQPSYITFEPEGVNARSTLPRSAEEVGRAAEGLDPVQDLPVIPNSLRIRVMDTVRHHVGNVLLWSVFPFYRTHRPYVIGRELVGWLPRYLDRKGRAERAARTQDRLLADPAPFFLYPLQLNSDFQIRLNSDFADVPDAIRNVLASFAHGAPEGTRLVVKNHPLDNGLLPYGEVVAEAADRLGLGDRVVYLDGGDGKLLMARCRGMVVVNSTMGLEGLLADRPVYCLGRSIYGFPGLAATPEELPLEDFWKDPVHADRELLERFVRVLSHRALVRGNYYTDEGIDAAIAGVFERLALRPAAT
ncbi:MAG: capsule biosynthesis protein [Pseudodesulfovibrio sp.]|uniref:capsule biosynthesis protein n=1 Tax=Pseudodesulfovibrio sp. TaxID=2035812 RepID=UPI003D0FB4B3